MFLRGILAVFMNYFFQKKPLKVPNVFLEIIWLNELLMEFFKVQCGNFLAEKI